MLSMQAKPFFYCKGCTSLPDLGLNSSPCGQGVNSSPCGQGAANATCSKPRPLQDPTSFGCRLVFTSLKALVFEHAL